MIPLNPLGDAAETDPDDLRLVRRVQDGDGDALEALVIRHQDWIYNIVLRMVYHPEDAEDATQEVLLKLLTKLSTFEGRSSFRTWLYRIVVNHVLNMKRARAEVAEWNFEKYGRGLDGAPDMDLPDPHSVPADVQLLVDEARITCSSGMLLCLDRSSGSSTSWATSLVSPTQSVLNCCKSVATIFGRSSPAHDETFTASCRISADWSTRPIHAAVQRRRRHS